MPRFIRLPAAAALLSLALLAPVSFTTPSASADVEGIHFSTAVKLRGKAASATAGSGKTIKIVGHLVSDAGERAVGGRIVSAALDGTRGALPLAQAVTDSAGVFTLKVSADWTYKGDVLVSAPGATGTDPKTGEPETYDAAESVVKKVAVASPRRGKGKASAFTLISPGNDVAYDACRDLTYRLNMAKAPAGFAKEVKKAFGLIHEASGLEFRYAGTTSRIPWATGRKAIRGPQATISIAWTTEKVVSPLRGSTIGIGGSGWFSVKGGGPLWFYEGGVALDLEGRPKPGFGIGPTTGELLLHEIGHAVGLGHSEDIQQIMFPALLGQDKDQFQAGDLAGMRKVGASNGCAPESASQRSVPVQEQRAWMS